MTVHAPLSGHINTFRQYQELSRRTAVYPGAGELHGLAYTALGLGESGEVQNKVKKILRGDEQAQTAQYRQEIGKELGDVLWYLAQVATELELDLGDIATQNLAKLNKRKESNTLKGSGDNR